MIKNELRLIKWKERLFKRCVKETIKCTKKNVIKKLLETLPKCLKHKFVIWHQYKAVNALKRQLTEGEVLVHVDFCTLLYSESSHTIDIRPSKETLINLCNHPNKNVKIKVSQMLSDGPSCQYKNKSNFYMFTQYPLHVLKVARATWSFSESGHGKGAFRWYWSCSDKNSRRSTRYSGFQDTRF